jgi:hypothetical protein
MQPLGKNWLGVTEKRGKKGPGKTAPTVDQAWQILQGRDPSIVAGRCREATGNKTASGQRQAGRWELSSTDGSKQ